MGVIAALYVSRVFIEFAPLDWPAPLVWFAGFALALASLAITLVLHAFGCEVIPVAALTLYLISPTIDPHLAAAAAFITVTGILLLATDHPVVGSLTQATPRLAARLPAARISDAGVFFVSLAIYIATLSPGLLPADSGEFQLVAPTLGIAHPPGYALYTLVGKVFTLIPVGTPAYRLNLMAAVLAAVTLTLVNRTTRQLTASMVADGLATRPRMYRETIGQVAGLVAVLTLAGATTFWAQATTANVRMPAAFFAALLLWLLVRYGETRSDRDLVTAAFAFGLGLMHHGSLAFIALPAGLYVLWIQPRILTNGRLLARCAAAFALALLILLYFPVRGAIDAPLNPGGLTTLEGFLNHVLARGFRGDVLAFTGRQVLLNRLRVLLNILIIQFGWPLLALAAIALIPPLRQSPISNLRSPFSIHHWLLLIGAFALTTGAAITYRAPQTVEYLMPAYVALAILVGIGAASTSATLSTSLTRVVPSSALRTVTLSIALVLGLANVRQIAPSYRELSRQSNTRQMVEPILRDAPANATIFSNWHWATAFWYLQTVEGLRPDVDVRYVTPAGAEPYPETWRRRLADSLDDGPVLATNRYQAYVDLPARLVPFHGAFLVTTAPVDVPAEASLLNLTFENTIKLHGYSLSTEQLEPGEDLRVRLWWEPLVDAQRDYSVFVHLVDASGQPFDQAQDGPVGQADVRYAADRLTQGTLIEDAYTLSVLPTVPPGEYTVIAGFYFTPPGGGFQRLTTNPSTELGTSGADAVRLGNVTLVPRRSPPVTRHRFEVPFAGGPTLIGADYDTSLHFDGAQYKPESSRIYLHWRVPGSGGPWTALLVEDGRPVAQTQVAAAPAGSPSTCLPSHRQAGSSDVTSGALSPALERSELTGLSLSKGHRFLTTALDVSPGTNRLRLEVIDDTGETLAAQGAWRLPVLGASVRLPRIGSGDRYLIFGGEIALAGADWQKSGREVIVDLKWISLKPLVRDYSVSVQLRGESGWRAQHDGTPALGAIPTLKWIRGTRVVDRHRIELPEGAAGPADIRISVYDAFTQAPLGVLDDRFQRAGQGLGAVIGRVNDQ